MANQLQTTCENLWSIVAGRRPGGAWRAAPPAFVGCISGLGGAIRDIRVLFLVIDRRTIAPFRLPTTEVDPSRRRFLSSRDLHGPGDPHSAQPRSETHGAPIYHRARMCPVRDAPLGVRSVMRARSPDRRKR